MITYVGLKANQKREIDRCNICCLVWFWFLYLKVGSLGYMTYQHIGNFMPNPFLYK